MQIPNSTHNTQIMSTTSTMLHLYASQGTAKIDDTFIRTHPLTHSLRANRRFIESRPHLRAPETLRAESLLAGSLAGSEKIAVPPYIFNESNGKRCVVMMHLGGRYLQSSRCSPRWYCGKFAGREFCMELLSSVPQKVWIDSQFECQLSCTSNGRLVCCFENLKVAKPRWKVVLRHWKPVGQI